MTLVSPGWYIRPAAVFFTRKLSRTWLGKMISRYDKQHLRKFEVQFIKKFKQLRLRWKKVLLIKKREIKGATKSYFTHYSYVVIIFFKMGLYKSVFFSYSFGKLVLFVFPWFLCFLPVIFWIQCNLHKFYNFITFYI